MARRRAMIGTQRRLVCDCRTRGGTVFKRGEVVTVTAVQRGATPISVRAADGRTMRTQEEALEWCAQDAAQRKDGDAR